MAVTGTIRVDGTLNGYPDGSVDIAVAWTINTATLFPTYVGLVAGDNPFTIPNGVTLIGLYPPAANAVQFYVKPAGATTGQKLAVATPTFLGNNDTVLVLNADSPIPAFKIALY